MLSEKVATAIAVAVTVVWLINFFADLFLPGYESQAAIHGVFTTVVAGSLLVGRGRSEKDG